MHIRLRSLCGTLNSIAGFIYILKSFLLQRKATLLKTKKSQPSNTIEAPEAAGSHCLPYTRARPSPGKQTSTWPVLLLSLGTISYRICKSARPLHRFRVFISAPTCNSIPKFAGSGKTSFE